jgi:hypothetical protein
MGYAQHQAASLVWQAGHGDQVTVVQGRDFGGSMTSRFVTGGGLFSSRIP